MLLNQKPKVVILYMLSFHLNMKKEIGVRKIRIRDKLLVEAVV